MAETWGIRLADGRVLREGYSCRPLRSKRDAETDFDLTSSAFVGAKAVRLDKPAKTEKPLAIHTSADGETLEIRRGKKILATANHDEHGWAGMGAVEDAAKAIAKAYGIKIDETEG